MAHTQPAHSTDAFSKNALARIASAISKAEDATHAEIRVAIHDERETNLTGKPIADVAKSEFAKLGMHKTKSRTGLLLMILYSEHKFYIHADEGIHSKVTPETWTDVAATLSEAFAHGHFEEGVIQALAKITEHLRGVLSTQSHSENELSNEVSIS